MNVAVMRDLCWAAGFSIWLAAFGCTKGPTVADVTGEVTLDGQPLKAGHVQFVPIAGDAQTAGELIRDGKFAAKVPITKLKVELHATKVVGKRKAYDTPESPWEEEVAEMLPARYNAQSDITLDVKPGTQAVKYDLKSK